tara:strand:- start:4351 stop:4926 length:576 start_codon:yes stop_codon:yes gene_type:complete
MTPWQAFKKHPLSLFLAPFSRLSAIPIKAYLILTAIIAFALLVISFVMQHGFGYKPCAFCIFERWPYVALILLGFISLSSKSQTMLKALATLMLIAITTNIGLSGYHIAIERKWVPLPSVCQSQSSLKKLSFEDLKKQIKQTNHVSCDRIPVKIFGLSPVEYNLLINLWLFFYIGSLFFTRQNRHNLKGKL